MLPRRSPSLRRGTLLPLRRVTEQITRTGITPCCSVARVVQGTAPQREAPAPDATRQLLSKALDSTPLLVSIRTESSFPESRSLAARSVTVSRSRWESHLPLMSVRRRAPACSYCSAMRNSTRGATTRRSRSQDECAWNGSPRSSWTTRRPRTSGRAESKRGLQSRVGRRPLSTDTITRRWLRRSPPGPQDGPGSSSLMPNRRWDATLQGF